MKITSRAAAAAASFTAGAMLLTGCAAQDKPAPSVDGVSIELWIGDRITQAGMDATREIAADWEAETGNTVEIVDNSFFELMNKIPVAVPAGEGPDAFLLTNNYVGQFVSQNLIAPVAISDDERAQFVDGAVDSFSLDGETYGVPLVADVQALVYNKALLPEVPETFDELVETAAAMNDGSTYGLLFPIDQFWSSFAFLAAEGGYIFGESDGAVDVTDLGLDSAGSVAGLEYLVSLINDTKLMPADTTAEVAQGMFSAGKAAAIIEGPAAVANFEAAGIEVGVAPIPVLASGNGPAPFATYTGLAMSVETDEAEATQSLLSYLGANLPAALQEASNGNISALAGADTVGNDQLAGWTAQLAQSYPLPTVPEMNLVWGPAIAAFTQAIHGQATAADALAEAQKAIADAIAAQ
ncbi:MAG TPA: extracellular solute-binding protein [Protaetiibacter sp.]|nr:extracellular solute-binding protein [Protaetiibacter sp.]